MKKTILFALLLITPWPAFAEVKLPALFSDNMVLQQDFNAPVWGWADPGEKVSVKGSWQLFGGSSATADKNGKWMLKIKTPKASGPFSLTVRGKNVVKINNVLIGEVWICSGQSNMQMRLTAKPGWKLKGVFNYPNEIAAANYPDIRMFTVKKAIADEPQPYCEGSWSQCSPETAGGFSAAGYFFARELHKELGIPFGMIHTSWGGTPAEAWTSEEYLRQLPDYVPIPAKNQNTPTVLYNAMIAPIIPYGIKGAIWYQGESNTGRAYQYRTLFPTMIQCWRNDWAQGDFPFYFVQIAPFNYGSEYVCPELQEAQLMTLSLPNTGMAVTTDIGNPIDIHPRNKQMVGRRLALWALAKNYGRKDIVYSGPLYGSMQKQGDKIRIFFDHTGSGLFSLGGNLKHFTIAGENKEFVEATAEIDNNTVVVSSPDVKKPLSVRYAWTNTAVGNLYNFEMLPASPFRTDDWPGVTYDKK